MPDVVILAGGLGTRLRGAVPDRPKVLAPVAGRPFLAHLLDRIATAGATRAILALGYQADAVRNALGIQHGPLAIRYVVDPEPLGTAGALVNAASEVRTDDVLVFNGDTIVLSDLAAVVRRHQDGDRAFTMVTVRATKRARFGSVRTDERGIVVTFEEKADGGSGYVNGGVYVLRRTLLAELPRRGSLEHEVLPLLVERRQVAAYACDAPFVDIGTPESYAHLRAHAERFIPHQ